MFTFFLQIYLSNYHYWGQTWDPVNHHLHGASVHVCSYYTGGKGLVIGMLPFDYYPKISRQACVCESTWQCRMLGKLVNGM